MAELDDRTFSQRREIKYLVSEREAEAIYGFIAPYMERDGYTTRGTPEGYPIASLYVDSPDCELCRQTVKGEKNRFKLRIRTYGDDPATPVFFEIKRRVDQIIFKERAAVHRAAARQGLLGGVPPGPGDTEDPETAVRFFSLARDYAAAPLARVRYFREAFESRDRLPLRMTFDRRLEYILTDEPEFSLNGPGWREARVPGVIFEIKFRGSYPQWVGELVRRFSLEARSIPKYVIAMNDARRLPAGMFEWVGGV